MLFWTLSISPSINSNSECRDSINPSISSFIAWTESISLPMFSICSLNPSTSVLICLILYKLKTVIPSITIKIEYVLLLETITINNVPDSLHAIFRKLLFFYQSLLVIHLHLYQSILESLP